MKDEVDFLDHKRGSSMCTILTYILRNTSLLFLFIGPILHLALKKRLLKDLVAISKMRFLI